MRVKMYIPFVNAMGIYNKISSRIDNYVTMKTKCYKYGLDKINETV